MQTTKTNSGEEKEQWRDIGYQADTTMIQQQPKPDKKQDREDENTSEITPRQDNEQAVVEGHSVARLKVGQHIQEVKL